MSSSNSPCAACKCLRRKCTQECVFAPYFPADQPQKFAYVHKVFGASNVTKLLNELNVSQREDAVNSLAYEAETRLRDPVYGCVGLISILQHKLDLLQKELASAKKELATYVGPHAMIPTMMQPSGAPPYMGNPSMSAVVPYNMMPMMGIPTAAAAGGPPLVIRDHQSQQQQQQQQAFDAQQLAAAVAARERQEMIRAYEQQQIRQQQQQQLEIKFDASGFDGVGNSVSPSRYNNPTSNVISPPPASPSLALGSFDNPYQIQAHQLSLQPQQGQAQDQQEHAQEQRSGSEERTNNNNNGGPSC